MCLVMFTKQVAVLSLYNMKLMVFIKRGVYCAVRTEYLIQFRLILVL